MKKENLEVQSRRDFFKKAAKGALPILGAIMLANIPVGKAIANTECDGCYGGCQGSCSGKCYGGCKGDCNNTCQGTCDNSCHGGCSDVCKN